MLNSYLTLPLNCERMTHNQRQQRCELKDSIAQHLQLIIRTHFNECRFDNNFGCMIWENDFDTIRSVENWKMELLDSIQKALKTYELRVANLRIEVNMDDVKVIDPRTRKLSEIRKRINIYLSGNIHQTNEPFHHQEYLYFSPLSLT